MSHIEADPILSAEVPDLAPDVAEVHGQEPEAVHPPEAVPEPAFTPRPYAGSRGWAAGASLMGALFCGAAGLTLQAQRNPLLDAAANPAPAELPGVVSPDQDRLALLPGPRFVGPPKPATPPDLQKLAGAAPFFPTGPGLTGIAPSGSGLRGGIGYFGPVSGPLNTDLSGVQVVRGPIWTGKPLPAVGGGFLLPRPEAQPESSEIAQHPPQVGAPEVGSELPDMQKLALARLANPLAPGAAKPAPAPVPAPAVSAEKPLSVSLSVARPANGYAPGATVAVRASASADAYFVLIGVDADGRASTLFKSPGPARSFGYAIRAQTQPGPQYVVVVASAHPPTGGDVAAALRAHGPGFLAPTMQLAAAAAQPGGAWSAAVAHAAGLGGGTRGWKRFEWSVGAASFFTRPPAKVAERPAPEKPEKPEKPAAAEKPAEDSVVPGKPEKPEAPAPSGEKSVMPTLKPVESKPQTAAPETGK